MGKDRSLLQQEANGVASRFIRRVQLTGGSTFVVSLPSQWVKAVGLRPKQELFIVPQGDLSLLILAGPKDSELTGGFVDATQCKDESEALREFIANYIAGFDSIKIRCKIGDLRNRLKVQIREKLIGVEVIEESTEYLVMQCLHGDADLPLNRALRRMALIVGSMLQDSVKSLTESDVALAQEVIGRDDEVDRFAHYIFRQLNRSLLNPALVQDIGMSNIREFIPFTVLVRSIERIADHATQIASSAIDLEGARLDSDFMIQVDVLSKRTISLFEKAMNTVFTLDPKKAHDVIREVGEILELEKAVVTQIFKSRLNAKQVSLLRLCLESVKRVAEYSADICEVVVDVSVSSAIRLDSEGPTHS